MISSATEASGDDMISQLASLPALALLPFLMKPHKRSADMQKALEDARSTADPERLEQLVTYDNVEVLMAVAANPKAPSHVLARLANDELWIFQEVVAGNPSCPTVLLSELAVSDDPTVRAAVASNPSCPEGMFTDLGADPDEDVLAAVVEAPHAPAHARSLAALSLN